MHREQKSTDKEKCLNDHSSVKENMIERYVESFFVIFGVKYGTVIANVDMAINDDEHRDVTDCLDVTEFVNHASFWDGGEAIPVAKNRK